MKTKIENIWLELEEDKSFKIGLLYRRYSSSVKPDVLIGIQGEKKSRFLAIGYSNILKPDITAFVKLRDINVEAIADPDNNKRSLLILILDDSHLTDIFSVVCEDIIAQVADIDNEKRVLKEVLVRLEKWQALFEKLNPDGLSWETQRGLYGELFFLRKLLDTKSNKMSVVQSWVGPSPELQDFQLNALAVEVKTTSGNNHQRIYISNERQLDESVCGSLFLFHLSLDVRPKNGESLNEIVQSIGDKLDGEFAAYSIFSQKLIEVGYFNQHQEIYQEKGYTIRGENYFKVDGDFPRLKEENIPRGVGDVKYSINISECFDFSISESELMKLIYL